MHSGPSSTQALLRAFSLLTVALLSEERFCVTEILESRLIILIYILMRAIWLTVMTVV